MSRFLFDSPPDASHAPGGWDCSGWRVHLPIFFDLPRSGFRGFVRAGLGVDLDVGRCGRVSGEKGC